MPSENPESENRKPLVGIAMGSESDWPTMEAAAMMLRQFDVPFEARVLSAHRTPEAMTAYAELAAERGLKVIIAGAGGAAHLPGMLAASTILPVIGVPVATRHLKGLDSLLSIVQMPGGVPVATVAIGQAKNAALLAVQVLATADERLANALVDYKTELKRFVSDMDERVRREEVGSRK
ncbi:MAG: 5-(carboxyamino)imidazole ribonucleotide mutase [Rhodothermaceae bacterium]|nr:5-(carboxyamino)imidazole ribonucleotide mutase [Rhodothermaceae bacterium]